MINDRTRVVVDPSQVVHETLDGETLLIHLPSGTYFNLTGWGAHIWALLVEGHALGDILAGLTDRAALSPAQVAVVRIFIEGLVAETLLCIDTGAAPAKPDIEASPTWQLLPAEYRPPELTRYEDMQHMLLLDPIHDATAAGWPAHHGATS